MLNLLIKDFKLLFAGKGSVKKNIASTISSLLLFAAFLMIETFLFSMILNKIRNYDNATIPFLTLFLFVISCIIIILDTLQAKKLFFNEKDTDLLIIRPISNIQIVSSKLFFLFLTHYITTILLIYPIIVSYGIIIGKTPVFYYIGVLYPLFSFFFECGIALILVYPLKLLSDFLKKHTVAQFVLALIIMVIACFGYDAVLSSFMTLVVNNDIGALFTVEAIETLSSVRTFLFPAVFYADIFFSSLMYRILPYLFLSVGLFTLGATFAIASFSFFRSIQLNNRNNKQTEPSKLLSPKMALLKKEFLLLFRDSGNIFSFTGLLMIQPFLVYIVVNSLNSVFSSGAFAYYMTALPELIPLIDMVIIMLFTLIINSGATEYIQMEQANVRIMKTLPISPVWQSIIKVGVPFGLSVFSLLVTTIVLWATGTISFLTFAFSTLLTILLLLTFDIVSLKEEFKLKNAKRRSMSTASIYSYLMPVLFFLGALVGAIFGLELILAYLLGTAAFALIAVPHFLFLKRKIISGFLDMELVN